MKKLLIITLLFISYGCEKDETTGPTSTEITNFDISHIDTESTGASGSSQPEIIRFVSATTGVFVDSKRNEIRFVTISESDISLSGEEISLTDDPDAESSSIDVSDDESIIAVVTTKGACSKGELYLLDAATKTKNGPFELGFNPDAIDISTDNKFVVVANEFDYADGLDGGCESLGLPSVTVYDISGGISSATMVKDIKLSHMGANGNLPEPEGLKIAPDKTVYVTLQESSEIGYFSLSSIPDTLSGIIPLADGHRPDGIYVSIDGSWAMTAGEYDGNLGMVDLSTKSSQNPTIYYHQIGDDLPSTYNFSMESKGLEPEECYLVEKEDKWFGILTLQDPGAVVVYDITDPAKPVYDSSFVTDESGEAEGLSYRDGYVLVSNTEAPSISLLKASWID